MIIGNSIIEYLEEETKKNDPAESSHWKKFNYDFKFDGKNFTGLKGFGELGIRFFGISNLIHNVFQKPWKKIGKEYSLFSDYDKIAKNISNKQNRTYDKDFIRHTLTLSLLKEKFPNYLSHYSTISIIGDGFATMTSLLLATYSTKQIILVNLSKPLTVDLFYLRLWLGEDEFNSSVCLINNKKDLDFLNSKNYNKDYKVVAIQAKDRDLLSFFKINLAINMLSMQEMDKDMIKSYFDILRKIANDNKLLFYCANRETKELPDGTNIKFSEYPWAKKDEVIFDELCPVWHQQTYSYNPPFYRNYDGSFRHRLCFLSKYDNKYY